MLELREPELQLVQFPSRCEPEVLCELLDAVSRALAQADGVAAPAARVRSMGRSALARVSGMLPKSRVPAAWHGIQWPVPSLSSK